MSLQQQIAIEKQKELIGKELKVLVETKTFDGKYYVGRSYMDVPDIDGLIYIEMIDEALEGKFVECKIISANNYDLMAKKIK